MDIANLYEFELGESWYVEADMKSDTPLETTVIFFIANLYLKQGISS